MSEPYSAFFKINISRESLIKWLAAPTPEVSQWSDWDSIEGDWNVPGADSRSVQGGPKLPQRALECESMLNRYPNNRAALEFILRSAEAESTTIAAFDHRGEYFVAGSLAYSESIYDIIFFLAIARGAAEFLGANGTGLALVHDYIWGDERNRKAVAALRLTGVGVSEFLAPDACYAAANEFESQVENMLDGRDDPEFSPRVQLDQL